MTVHLLKVCVGIESIDHLRRAQAHRLERQGALRHLTRHTPRRADEVTDGGSLYWIIRGAVRVRQRITGIEEVRGPDGKRCALVLDPELVPTEPLPRRPHQGWRYFEADAVPRDLPAAGQGHGDMPPEMVAELRELGLL